MRRELGQGEKLAMQRRIEIELENMAHLSRPYLSDVRIERDDRSFDGLISLFVGRRSTL